jgi:hypothetical protein
MYYGQIEITGERIHSKVLLHRQKLEGFVGKTKTQCGIYKEYAMDR